MPAKSRHWTIDRSDTTALARCSACGARFLTGSRPAALAAIADHIRRGHPELPHTIAASVAEMARRERSL